MKNLGRHITLLLLMALMVLTVATSCYNYDQGVVVEEPDGTFHFIKVTISISSNSTVTRSDRPQGGENGDGREKGIDTRENAVDGVTIIFFQNSDGINASAASAENTKIDYVAYYTVSLDNNYTPKYGTHLPDEVYYSTEEHSIEGTVLDPKNSYHMLVVANADLTSQITAGTTTLAQARDMVHQTLYTGTGKGVDATKFVMSSEKDNVLDFSYSKYDETLNRRTFLLDNIHIERMAARIDFLAKGATYSTEYDHSGYVYNVNSEEHFVLTSIVPFNINYTGNEYIFKRTNDTAPYLADETTTNWVIDPYTSDKTTTTVQSWMASTLTQLESANASQFSASQFNISMESQQSNKINIDGYDNIIVVYPKENTLRTESPLYYYATGLAIEGYYYTDNSKTDGERRVYYHYLRHQGENETYNALRTLDKTTTCGSAKAMNYGVVRNNIYRVDIVGITPDDKLILHIKVKKWDEFTHEVIYM